MHVVDSFADQMRLEARGDKGYDKILATKSEKLLVQ